jgi:uncharacterized protein
MLTSRLLPVAILAAVLVPVSAHAFDSAAGSSRPAAESRSANDVDAFRLGAEYYNIGELEAAFDAFSRAAEQGNAIAQWKVGRMYADGEGIPEDDYKAFQMFSQIADTHAEDNPYSPVSRVVADAFVSLGNYYKSGIAGAGIQPNIRRAVDLFTHAATYFGDANAQYQLARLYLDGQGVQPDANHAARWLNLAARKNHAPAQATLGDMLVYGHGVRAMPAEGYMWLLVARDYATPADRDWILALNHRAEQALTSQQKEAGAAMARQWLERTGG